MKVRDAIIALLENYKLDDDLIVAWWDQKMFDLPADAWEEFVDKADDNMDWSSTHDQLSLMRPE